MTVYDTFNTIISFIESIIIENILSSIGMRYLGIWC